jgi:hypothetical protein
LNREVGRWDCTKCGKPLVAAGPRVTTYKGSGAFMGPCPWSCGAWINRAFRFIQPGEVSVFRADEWDRRYEGAAS